MFNSNLKLIFPVIVHSFTLIICDGATATESDVLATTGTIQLDTQTLKGKLFQYSQKNLTSNTGEATTISSKFSSSNANSTEKLFDYVNVCPSNVECVKLGSECIKCEFHEHCLYGTNLTAWCQPKENIICKGSVNFTKWYICQYCYQTANWNQQCTESTRCHVIASPTDKYLANCTVEDNILCLGQRKFHKYMPCNWSSGKRWSTALILSITLGGFGADRFYLGLWREGIGKLFSFGGLGVWTLLDVVLISTGYVGPADGSLYL